MKDADEVRVIWNGTMDVRVREVDTGEEGRSLIFATDFGSRSAIVYPANWRELTDAGLLKISENMPD